MSCQSKVNNGAKWAQCNLKGLQLAELTYKVINYCNCAQFINRIILLQVKKAKAIIANQSTAFGLSLREMKMKGLQLRGYRVYEQDGHPRADRSRRGKPRHSIQEVLRRPYTQRSAALE